MNHIQTVVIELTNTVTFEGSTKVGFLRGETWRYYYPGYESFKRLNRSIRDSVVTVPSAWPHRLRISIVPDSKQEPYEPPF